MGRKWWCHVVYATSLASVSTGTAALNNQPPTDGYRSGIRIDLHSKCADKDSLVGGNRLRSPRTARTSYGRPQPRKKEERDNNNMQMQPCQGSPMRYDSAEDPQHLCSRHTDPYWEGPKPGINVPDGTHGKGGNLGGNTLHTHA